MRRNYSYLVIVLLLASVISGIIVPSKNVRGALDSATQQLGSSATSDPIREYPITTHNAGPLAIVASPKGSLWFTEFTAGKIAEFFPLNATFREFQVPQSGAAPASLAIDKNGQVWFSDQSGSGSIWTFNPSIDKFIQYKTPTTNSTPLGVTIDRDNNVWFAELTGNRLGVLMYPTYSLTEFSLPTQNSGPAEMTVQPSSSKIWITETYANKIAEFDITTKSFNEFPSTVSIRSPVGIVLDGAGNVWVSEHGGSSIIIFNPTNSSFRKYPTSVPPTSTGYDISAPATLAIDNQGRLWFVEHFSNKVGRLEPGSGTMEEFVIPTQGAYSVLNALDSAGNFWFTEFSANQIGSIRANATTPVGVSSIPLQTTEGNSGLNTITEFVITNRLATPIEVMMNT
jgi:virginiamycin B lyase